MNIIFNVKLEHNNNSNEFYDRFSAWAQTLKPVMAGITNHTAFNAEFSVIANDISEESQPEIRNQIQQFMKRVGIRNYTVTSVKTGMDLTE